MNINPEYIFVYKYDLYDCKDDKILKEDLCGCCYSIDTIECKSLLQELKRTHTIDNNNGTLEINIREIEIFRPKNHLQKKTIEKWSNDDQI